MLLLVKFFNFLVDSLTTVGRSWEHQSLGDNSCLISRHEGHMQHENMKWRTSPKVIYVRVNLKGFSRKFQEFFFASKTDLSLKQDIPIHKIGGWLPNFYFKCHKHRLFVLGITAFQELQLRLVKRKEQRITRVPGPFFGGDLGYMSGDVVKRFPTQNLLNHLEL